MFLNENTLKKAFTEWIKKIKPKLENIHIAIDGKTIVDASIKSKILKAARNTDYLEKMLGI